MERASKFDLMISAAATKPRGTRRQWMTTLCVSLGLETTRNNPDGWGQGALQVVGASNRSVRRTTAADLPVPLAHTFGVWRLDVLLNDHLPAMTTQPTAEESLHLADLLQVVALVAAGSAAVLLVGFAVAAGRQPPFLLERTQLP